MATTPTRSRNRRGEGTRLRDEIVTAAAALLEETGSEDAVTLRAIARRVGIAAPSIYAHFADRDAILEAVVREAFTELAAAVQEAGTEEPDAPGRLRAVCSAYLAFADERPNRYRVLFGRHRREGTPRMTEPKSPDALLGAEAFDALVGAVRACVESGDSTSDAPGHDATALWVALHGFATLRASVPAFPWPDREALLTTLVDRLARIEATDAR
ncbi:MAG: TetR/AcrR family transcriptional regulator [Actinomycetes bacterium]